MKDSGAAELYKKKGPWKIVGIIVAQCVRAPEFQPATHDSCFSDLISPPARRTDVVNIEFDFLFSQPCPMNI